MNKLSFLLALLLLVVACKPKSSKISLFDDLNVRFDQIYPTSLELPDGSRVKRVDDFILIYFDSVPTLNQLAPNLKSLEFIALRDSFVNNTPHMMWIKKGGGGSLEQNLKNLKNTLGVEAKWTAPTYSLNSSTDKENLFVPLPRTLVVKTELLNNELKNEFARIGLTEVDRELTDYTVYTLDVARPYTIYPIAAYLRSMNEFKTEGSYYFENLPFQRPVFTDPNDPFWGQQKTPFEKVNIPAAWPSEGSNLVKVAIIDAGFNLASQDLSFSSRGRRMDNSRVVATPHYMANRDHGTAVASILAAKRNNRVGIAGVAGSVSIFPLALVNNTDLEVAEAIDASIAENVDIVNMSIGTFTWKSSILSQKLELAYAKGVLLIAASGNDSKTDSIAMPAAHPRVMAIGGSNLNDTHDVISNYGDRRFNSKVSGISVVAPDLLVTVDYNGIKWTMHGTSAACPLVAGVASMIKSKYPSLTHDQIRKTIESSAAKVGGVYKIVNGFPNGTRDPRMGYGRLNAVAAFDRASRESSVVQPR